MSFSPHDAAVHAIGRSRALLVASKDADSSTLNADMRRLSVSIIKRLLAALSG